MKMFTDQEIESWLDGSYDGDKIAMESYLNETDEGRARLAAIRSFYAALKEQPLPSLSFSLSEAVAKQIADRKIENKKKLNVFFAPIAILTIIAVAIAGYLFIDKYSFVTTMNGVMAGVILLLAALFVGMGLLDWNEQRKRYERLILD